MDLQIKKTQNYYDGISSGYKQLYHDEQILKIQLVRNYFPKKGNILDLGCGDGVLNKFISNNVYLISLDLSFYLLKLNSNNNKIQASITKLPFKEEIFDLIFAFTIIQDLPTNEIKNSIIQIKKVLKKSGKLIISFLKISKKAELIENELKKNFTIITKIEEEKDFIFILENTQ